MPGRFHVVQFVIAGVLAMTATLGYIWCPRDRAEGLLILATTLIGFIVGKFSNGYGRKT